MVSHADSLPLRTLALAALIFLSLTTAQAQMKGDFDAADANHDGHVTFEEFATYAKQQLDAANGPKAQRFKQLSSQRQTKLLQRRFDKVDRGHKGYLDRDDWSAPSAS